MPFKGPCMVLPWFDMHSLFWRAGNYTACFHNPHFSVALCEKVGILALCLCTCVIPKNPEHPPWISMKKATRATCDRGSGGGLKWLQYSGISNDSWILKGGKWVHISLCYFYVSFLKSQREKSEWEASIKRIIAATVSVRLASSLTFQNMGKR